MRHKTYLIIIVLFLVSNSTFAQFRLEERVQANHLASKSPKSIFLVDFWATWCGPCIHLWKQLEIFQEHFPDDLYIISLTKENKSDIIPFLQKHPSKLAVGIDKGGELQKQLGGKLIPFGAMYNASGKLLWKGNPSDLNFKQLSSIIKRAKNRVAVDDFFSFNEDVQDNNYLTEFSKKEKLPLGSYKLIKHKSSYAGNEAIIQRLGQQLSITGRVPQLLAFLMKSSNQQFIYENKENVHYSLLINASDGQKTQEAMFTEVLNQLNLMSEKRISLAEVFEINPKSNGLFWDTNELNWGEESNQVFIMDKGQLLADNCTLEMLLYKIASVRGIPFVIQSPLATPTKQYDWNVHYKYDDLMEASFEELGIEIRKVETLIPIYNIEAK